MFGYLLLDESAIGGLVMLGLLTAFLIGLFMGWFLGRFKTERCKTCGQAKSVIR
jgi:hypothetical protein